ncbi:hypothetical protein HDU98_011286 [Podochytrium sp. JEL0797]|nr:hypothetical protein HDU98_011286 [Podochytrium sp. JEL0797]
MTLHQVQTTVSHRAYISKLPRNLQIPRDQWASHPNYGVNTLLVKGHASFRKTSQEVLEGIRSLNNASFQTAGGQSPRVLLDRFREWHGYMSGHENYEEAKLYPFLCRRWQVDPSYLSNEHGELHEKRDTVLHAFNRYLNFDGNNKQYGSESVIKAAANLEQAMAEYDTLLRIHLAEEEEFVIPMLLELSREEFEEYYDTRAPELFRKMDKRDKALGIRRT